MADGRKGFEIQDWMMRTLWARDDYEDYQRFWNTGGRLSYEAWKRTGKPKGGAAQLSPRAIAAFKKAGIKLPAGVAPPEGEPADMMSQVQDYIAAQKAIKEAKKEEALDTFVRLEPQDGYLVPVYRKADGTEYMDWGGKVPSTGWVSPAEERRMTREEEEAGQTATHQAWVRRQAGEEAEREDIRWKEKLEAEKQEQLASLRANPRSWLEYASLAGEPPAIQPWMIPMMGQQYPELQAGEPLPGYQAGGESMAGLLPLPTPSRQYQARMGPTAMAQYSGYEQARTGITPEELQFRLWSQAPPGEPRRSLSWRR